MRHSPGRLLLGMLVAATLALSLGCTAPAAGPAAAPAAGGDAGPVQPKVNRVVMAVDPLNGIETNEVRQLSSPTIWPFRSVYDYPVALDPKTNKLTTGLATSWAWEPDGMAYRVKLRENVPFHGDKWGAFGAQDLIGQWKELTLQDTRHGQATYWRAALKNIEVVNDHEVLYRLNQPDSQFVAAISETQGGAEVRSKAQADAAGRPTAIESAQVGTGPYMYKSRQSNVNLVLERAPFKHWSGVTPDFPEFEFRFIKEASTKMAALLSGEVHLAALPQDLMPQAEKAGMKVLRGQFPGVRIFARFHCCAFVDEPWKPGTAFRFPDSPLMDVRVRKAMQKAVNLDELNRAFFAGKGEPMVVTHLHPKGAEGWDPSWDKRYKDEYGYDVDAAKKLLTEAGYGPGKPFKTSMFIQPVTGVAGGPDIEEAVAGYWRQVGIETTLLTVDAAEFTRQAQSYKYDNHIEFFGTGASAWTGFNSMNSSFRPGGGVRTAQVEKDMLDLLRTMDDNRRQELWRDMGEQLFTQHMNVNLFWLPAEAMSNPQIVGDWLFPGSITGSWTHLQNIRAAR